MLSLPKLALMFALAVAAWFFYRGIRVRERALQTGRRYCQEFGLQLLDETVQRERLSLSRNSRGNWQVWRRYCFEYTDDGENRRTGLIVTLGERVQMVELDGQRILQ